ncbi:HSD17B10 [Cordylochernes scorpioides]|uniref:HSD17B10 n=1 Tax=Cordylochernes scorpioides TaxID=51811 RepID=A0ABY6KIQ1_9ARAC|nr:HSD17B10 [Cordylochernes scorpioides]
MSVQGLTTLVAGGSTGLGRATVERLLNQGAKAVICDKANSPGEQLAKQLGTENCLFVPADENTLGTFNLTRLSAAVMGRNTPAEDGHRGVMVMTSTTSTMDGYEGQAAIAASMGGVSAMTLPLCRELGRIGIRVCTLAPGLGFASSAVGGLPSYDLCLGLTTLVAGGSTGLGRATVERLLNQGAKAVICDKPNSPGEQLAKQLGTEDCLFVPADDSLISPSWTFYREGPKFYISEVPCPKRLGHPDEFAHAVQFVLENSMMNGTVMRIDAALRLQ